MLTDLSCSTCEGTGDGFDCSIHGFIGHHEVRTDKTCPRPLRVLQQCQQLLTRTQPCPDCGGSGIAAWAVEAAKDVDLFDGVAHYRERTIAEIAVDVLTAVREEAKNHRPVSGEPGSVVAAILDEEGAKRD